MTVIVNPWITPTFAQLGPYCVNDIPGTLPGTSIEGYAGTWNPAVISTAAAGSTVYTFTPDAGQGCITGATMTVVVNPWITPVFYPMGPYCVNDVPGTLPGVSNNGITGTWNPAVISTATAGSSNYLFTPDAGQGCITGATMTIVVNPWVTPTFVQLGPYCQGDTPGLLPGSSIEGYTGTWNPATISTTAAGTTTYTFTPDAGQGCITGATMDVVVNPLTTPTFAQLGPYCVNAIPDPLPGVSINGISGTWNPATISTAAAGSTVYTFTPDAGQGCVAGTDMTVVVVPAGGSTTWTGAISEDWNNAGNWSNGIPACCIDVIIPAGLTNYPTLTVAGSCHNIFIDMGATLIDGCLLNICGTASVKRCYTKATHDWHLIGSPIQNALSGLFAGRYLESFDEATNLYTDISSTTVPLNVMQGYAMWCGGGCDGCVTFVGILNMCSISHDLMFTDLNHGWNLLSNPFVASIDWDLQEIPSAMGPTVWYLDAATGNYLWYTKNTGGTGSKYVPPTQGFFVRAFDLGGVMTIADAYKSHVNGTMYYKSDNANIVIIEANGNNYKDQAWINFNEQTIAGFDMNNDVDKIVAVSNPELPQIFTTLADGRKLAMNSLPQTTTVPMSFTAIQSGTFTINAVQTGACTKVVLEDLFKGTFTDLMTSSYTFDYTAGDAEGRFLLHFNGTSVQNNDANIVNIYSNEKDAYVATPASRTGDVKIMNMLGQEVNSGKIVDVLTKFTINEPGIYVVQATVNGKIYTKKVIIR
jgi:nitrogen fixation protein